MHGGAFRGVWSGQLFLAEISGDPDTEKSATLQALGGHTSIAEPGRRENAKKNAPMVWYL